MSDTPVVQSAEKQAAVDKAPSTSPWAQASRWSMFATLAIALVALVLAGLAYFQPTHTSGTAIPQQGGDAKANVCTAYHAAHNAVVINTHLQSPNPKDPTAELSVATSARLALVGGGTYLKERLAANSAAPTDLVNAVDAVANTIEQLGINYLNRAAADAQETLRRDLNTQIGAADKLCA
jgi:hypothetical protein